MTEIIIRRTEAGINDKERFFLDTMASPDPLAYLGENLQPYQKPSSVAIIVDGNGRWARKQAKSVTEGHVAGAERVHEHLQSFQSLPFVRKVFLWVFSPDNRVKREDTEVAGINGIAKAYAKTMLPELNAANGRFTWLGSPDGLVPDIIEAFEGLERATTRNTGQELVLGFNYKGEVETLEAARLLYYEAFTQGLLHGYGGESHTFSLMGFNTIDIEKLWKSKIDPKGVGKFDMLIRTGMDYDGGVTHLSGLGWRVEDAQLIGVRKLFPDFTQRDLIRCFVEYAFRERRGGGRPNQTPSGLVLP